jgi:hypothetical protein
MKRLLLAFEGLEPLQPPSPPPSLRATDAKKQADGTKGGRVWVEKDTQMRDKKP